MINQFSEEQQPRIDYDSSIESFDTEEAIIMPSSIPFKYDFDPNTLKKLTTKKNTTVGNDTEMVEVQLPLIGLSCTKFQLIYCVAKFRHVSNTLQWTTGPKVFNKWKQILKDAYDMELWDQYFQSNRFIIKSVANFWNLIRIFISLKCAKNTDTYDNHKDYLLAQKKPREMSVGDFVLLLQYHNQSVLPVLPEAPALRDDAILNDREFKAIFNKGMPAAWRERFLISKRNIPIVSKRSRPSWNVKISEPTPTRIKRKSIQLIISPMVTRMVVIPVVVMVVVVEAVMAEVVVVVTAEAVVAVATTTVVMEES